MSDQLASNNHQVKLCAALLSVIIMLMTGCGYPEVSPTAYELSKALYSACNRKSEEHVGKVKAEITKRLNEEEISQRESKWLLAIVTNAQSGEWDSATKESRRLMEDQIDR